MSTETEDGFDPRDAAKTAAAAAAVGAAVGAVRAFASRDRSSDDEAEPERDEPVAAGEQSAAAGPQEDTEQRPEPAPEPVPEPEPEATAPPQRHNGAAAGRLREVTSLAKELFRELHGGEPESVSSLDRTASGWAVTLEVLELRRIPETMDLLATYRVELDDDDQLVRYERCRRYYRAQSDLERER